MKSIKNFFLDLYYIFRGHYGKKVSADYQFAFIVNSRNHSDIYRKYPGFKWIPKSLALFIMKHMWPITLSKVTGVASIKSGKEIEGYVLGITMTAEQMLKNRDLALKKIRQALFLAKGRGVKIVGLGGLTSSMSRGGLDLLDIDINITTGHAYTAFNVTQNLVRITELFGMPPKKIKVAVVGAAGSVGSMTATLVARGGYGSVVLIDLKRKHPAFEDLIKTMKSLNHGIHIDISDTVNDIKGCDFIVTATNTSEALITADIVEEGMVIIDDAQPSDIHSDVLKMPNVLVLEAGVVNTPNIYSNFNYGLKNRTDNFCCMAELLILASMEWNEHYVINRATLENIDHISGLGKQVGFDIASLQNFLESISHDKIENVKKLALKKHGF